MPAKVPLATMPEASVAARALLPPGCTPSYAVSADGRWLLSGGAWDHSLRCTSLAAPEAAAVSAFHHTGVITCLAVGADGVTVVSGSADTTVCVWALYGGAAASAGVGACPRPLHVLSGHRGCVLCAALSTQMDLVLSGARPPPPGEQPPHASSATIDDGSGRRDGDAAAASPPPPVSGSEEEETAAAARQCSCAVWCALSGGFVRWLPVRGTPRAVAASPTGSGLLVYSDDDSGGGGGGSSSGSSGSSGMRLELFSMNGRPLRRVLLSTPMGQLITTRDGEMLVATEGPHVVVRRLHDLEVLHRYAGGDATPPATLPSAALAASIPSVALAPSTLVSALSLCAENHHAFVGTATGELSVLANPIVNIQVLEAIVVTASAPRPTSPRQVAANAALGWQTLLLLTGAIPIAPARVHRASY